MGLSFGVAERSDVARVGFRRRPMTPTNGASPERTDAILDSIGDGVFATDCSGTIRLWNRAAERLIGCSAAKAIGTTCATAMRLLVDGEPLDCRHGCPLLEADRSAGGRTVEVERLRADGRTQPLQMTVALVHSNGSAHEAVHSFRDISTIRQATEAQTMFLATASHELKTPLTVILGYAQSLRSGVVPLTQLDQTLDIIETRARELSRIVDRLLMTGRIQGGRMTLTLEAVEIDDLLRNRAEAFALASGRAITAEVQDPLPVVIADPEALKTAIDHLLENAVKYSPDGGPVTVRPGRAGTVVEIDIVDSGIGMSDDEAARCFDRFWQAESSDIRRFGGTGIGLYIVRTLIEAMGGSVRVRSKRGEGSVFTVLLRPHLGADKPEGAGTLQVGEKSIVKEAMRQLGIPYPGRPR